MTKKRSLSEGNILLGKKIKFDFDRRLLVAPSQLKNYILNDPLIDYLDYYKINKITDLPDIQRENSLFNSEFDTFIMMKGIDFERKIIDQYKYPILHIEGPISYESYYKTVRALINKTPIIYQGVLFDFKNKTYGCPDLIIRGDYLKLIYNETKDINDELYYIIDIKYSTITLSSDESFICNTGFVPVFKGQILVYTIALNEILNQNVTKGFILGKKYVNTKNKIKTTVYNDEYNKLAEINYSTFDSNYYDLINKAKEWIFKLRTHGHTWSLLPKPSVQELYPNMSNNKDGKWHNIKKELAEEIKDLTLIVNVGYKERLTAFSKGVYSYDDNNCSSEVLGINGSKSIMINKILEINSSYCLDIIKPDKIIYNENNWRQTKMSQCEFFIDYETTNDFEKNNFIFMIGVGYKNNDCWDFKCFISKNNSESEQQNMFNYFWEHINLKLKEQNKEEPIFIHWTSAEPVFYNKIKSKFSLPEKNFLDLYSVFINEPITIKGAFNYSLKTIAKTMYKHNLIQTSWSTSSMCNNGLDALLQGNKLYATKSDLVLDDMKDISYYNEIDCKVLYEILLYLRKFH